MTETMRLVAGVFLTGCMIVGFLAICREVLRLLRVKLRPAYGPGAAASR